MLNTENYVEKYLPIYMQRQISETFDAVLKRKQKKKLVKFNEVKVPVLMHAMFNDYGIPNLMKWQAQFHRIIMEDL